MGNEKDGQTPDTIRHRVVIHDDCAYKNGQEQVLVHGWYLVYAWSYPASNLQTSKTIDQFSRANAKIVASRGVETRLCGEIWRVD